MRYKLLTIAALSVCIQSCVIRSTSYVAPQEINRIVTADKCILVMTDSTEWVLKPVGLKPMILSEGAVWTGTKWELRPAGIIQDTLVGLTPDNQKKEIPFSGIESIRIEKKDSGITFCLGASAAVFALLGIGSLTAPEPPPAESCPFVYSYDGSEYVFDAEPYGGAICRGLERTEWCCLEHLREIGGRYRILVANELNETQYIDNFGLWIVDHPDGTTVCPDISGNMHTLSYPSEAIACYDETGTDIRPLTAEKDDLFWESPPESGEIQVNEDLQNELLFEFEKPLNASEARLIVNAHTTLWGSSFAQKVLQCYGDDLDDWYEEVNHHGPAFFGALRWFREQGLYLLDINVWTSEGWKPQGLIYSGGPYISEDRVYVLDLSDVPGDRLKIKLTPPAHFWRIDRISVDYSENGTFLMEELESSSAVDNLGANIRESISKKDGGYYVMRDIGNSAEIVFDAPPVKEGFSRSFFLKACGYYDIHLEVSGESRTDIIDRIKNEPGYTLRFACEEHAKWIRENRSYVISR